MVQRAQWRVIGLVQGVSFRAFTQVTARGYGLTGWVRNLSDGSVEIVAEGNAPQVAELIEWSKRGPRAARVERIEELKMSTIPAREFASFEIAPNGGRNSGQ